MRDMNYFLEMEYLVKRLDNESNITVSYIVTDGVDGNGPSSFTYAGSVVSSSNQIQIPSTLQ